MDLRDLIRDAQDVRREAVLVPEWGVTVWVRTLSGLERFELEDWMSANKGPDQKVNGLALLVQLIIRCTDDDRGVPVFTQDDATWLTGKSGAALGRIFEAATRLNRMSKTDQEELAKN